VDAAPATSTMSIKLTLDQVLSIEDQLDLYEKVFTGTYQQPNGIIERFLGLDCVFAL
jgi:hypothetical protein